MAARSISSSPTPSSQRAISSFADIERTAEALDERADRWPWPALRRDPTKPESAPDTPLSPAAETLRARPPCSSPTPEAPSPSSSVDPT